MGKRASRARAGGVIGATKVSGTGRVRVQVRRIGRNVWGQETREAFLDHLAATGNVERSAYAVGRTGSAAHALKRRDGELARAWIEAMDVACDRLQAQLVARAMGQAGGGLPNKREDERLMWALSGRVFGHRLAQAPAVTS